MYNTDEKIFIILFLMQKLTIIYIIALMIYKGLENFARVTYKIHKKRIIKSKKK